MNITSSRPQTPVSTLQGQKPPQASVKLEETWHVGQESYASTDELLAEVGETYEDAVYTWSQTHKAGRAPTLSERARHVFTNAFERAAGGTAVGLGAGLALGLLSVLTDKAELARALITIPTAVGAGAGALSGVFYGATTNPLNFTDSGSLSGDLSVGKDYSSFSVDDVSIPESGGYFNLRDNDISEKLRARDLQGTHSRAHHKMNAG